MSCQPLELKHGDQKMVEKQVNPLELFKITTSPKRIQEIEKSLKECGIRIRVVTGREQKVVVKFNEKEFILLVLKFQNERYAFQDGKGAPRDKYFHQKIGGVGVDFLQETSDVMNTYWQDSEIGLRELTKFTIEILKHPINYVEVDPKFANRYFIEWINHGYEGRVQKLIVNFQSEPITDENMKYILSSGIRSKYLGFHSKPALNFRHNLKFEADDVFIEGAESLTLENLMQMSGDNISVKLIDCHISSFALNGFLKQWLLNSVNMKMKHLYVVKYQIIPSQIFSGIERVASNVTKKFKVHDEFTSTISGGFTIRRGDGASASICLNLLRSTRMILEIYFWPDLDGALEDSPISQQI